MRPPEGNPVADTPAQPARNLFRLFILCVIGVQILVSLVSYPFMPPMVPSHWDFAGHVNGYMPRGLSAILLPGISIMAFILLRLLVAAGPRLGRANQRGTLEFVDRAGAGVALLFLVLQLIVLATTFGWPVDTRFVIGLVVSLMFIFMGNYLGKVRRNFWAGIRTPWTLASDVVWERTHRLGGWLFVLAGLLGLVLDFVPFIRIWGIMGLILLVCVALTIYSYVLYRRLDSAGKRPASPPFDDEGDARNE